MKWIRIYISSFFTYVFMMSTFTTIFCAFFLVVFGLRYIFAEASKTEENIARYFLIIFAVSIIMVPVTFYISNGLEKFRR